MNQLLSILLDALRKQAFSVILLCVAVGGLAWYNAKQEQRSDLQLAALQVRLDHCAEQHDKDVNTLTELKSEVAMLRVRIDIVSRMKR